MWRHISFWMAASVFLFFCGIAVAEDRALTVINQSTKVITGFFVTLDSAEASTVNMIASEGGLGADQSVDINIPSATDACVFDLKITYQDGGADHRPDVDFCNTDGYIIE